VKARACIEKWLGCSSAHRRIDEQSSANGRCFRTDRPVEFSCGVSSAVVLIRWLPLSRLDPSCHFQIGDRSYTVTRHAEKEVRSSGVGP